VHSNLGDVRDNGIGGELAGQTIGGAALVSSVGWGQRLKACSSQTIGERDSGSTRLFFLDWRATGERSAVE